MTLEYLRRPRRMMKMIQEEFDPVEKVEEFLTLKVKQHLPVVAKFIELEDLPTEKRIRTHSLDDLLEYARWHSKIVFYTGRYIRQSNVVLFEVITELCDGWWAVFEGEIHLTPEVF